MVKKVAKQQELHPHIKHLKRHRNILYGAVVMLLIIEVAIFVFSSSQNARIIATQNELKSGILDYINDLRQENQFQIGEIVKSISSQRKDFEREIDLLKNTQNDFSAVIEDAVKKVVTVSTDVSSATGFVIAEDGYIITNYHVVSDSSIINVNTYDSKNYAAEVIGTDVEKDIAILKADFDLKPFELADSNGVQVGEKVIAIGNPLGLAFTVTEGIVSAVHRTGPNGLNSYIQTDVTLNPGNSGGPLINKKGQVIGMNNFKVGDAEALGFALESNAIAESINSLVGNQIV